MNGEIIEMLPAAAAETFPGNMYHWGIELIKVIQRIESPGLTAIVKFITALGTEMLYVPLILFIFWWIDEKRGLRFGIIVIVSAWINVLVKDFLKQPRPYNLDPSVGLAFEPSYGAPSAHAQISMIFWVSAAAWLNKVWPARKPPIRAAAAFIILLIAFTRLYLGVHFPTDILAGWLIAGVILFLMFVPGARAGNFFASLGTRGQNICAALAALAMNGLYPRDRTLPALLLGFAVGYTLMKRSFPFSARAEINGKKPGARVMILRCLTGFLGVGIIHLGLRLVFPGEGSLFGNIPQWGAASPYYEAGRFIRYGLIGFWASAGAPRVFSRMGLAQEPVSGKEPE